MNQKLNATMHPKGGPRRSPAAFILVLAVCLVSVNCGLAPITKQATAFSHATVSVINSSEDAYRSAIKLHRDVLIAAAVADYDKNPTWSPYKDVKPLLTPDQLDARIKVLDGLKAYASTLVALTGKPSTKDESALNSAAAGVGSNLKALHQTLVSKFPVIPSMNAETANGVSTAARALGEYLMARKVKGELPKVTQEMDGHVEALCKLLESDVKVLRRQADADYQKIIVDQDSMIRHAGPALNPAQHRDEVAKLIDLANQQMANDELLEKLEKAINSLALTHHALAAAAQGNDQESIKQKLVELEAVGQDLGNFYSSLPSK